jgi:hypothetical protein
MEPANIGGVGVVDRETLVETGLATSAVAGRTAARRWVARVVSGADAVEVSRAQGGQRSFVEPAEDTDSLGAVLGGDGGERQEALIAILCRLDGEHRQQVEPIVGVEVATRQRERRQPGGVAVDELLLHAVGVDGRQLEAAEPDALQIEIRLQQQRWNLLTSC